MSVIEPLDEYFADFGSDAVLTTASGRTVTVRGILDRPYAAADVGGVGIEASEISFTGATTDLVDAVEGDTLKIALSSGATATTYAIRDVEPDGTGVTTLILQESI